MTSGIYWIEGPWPGKLGVAARPRGGDWLADEIANWRREGITTVVSLLTPEEESELSLQEESANARAQGLRFTSLPVPDRQTPASGSNIESVVHYLDSALSAGKDVLIHCRQGIGRSGLLAACLLIHRGLSAAAAVERVSRVRGTTVPETPEQRDWIDRYAAKVEASNLHPQTQH